MNLRTLLLMLFVCGLWPGATQDLFAAVQHGSAAYTLSPDKLRLAAELFRIRTAIGFASTAWTILQMLLLLESGAAAWMRRVTARIGGNYWLQGAAFYLLFLTLTSMLALPLWIYGHHVSLVYGQSVQSWGSWFGDRAKGFAITYVVGSILVLLLFFCIRSSPRRWWFWFSLPVMAAMIFGVYVTPILVDPLFDRFESLAATDPALVTRLEHVVARGGVAIPPERMFLMRASAKVTGLNAYVTGIGASKRVVVWDTTIAKATPDEIAFIFGHEMGHYVLHHIWKGIAFAAAGLLLAFFVGYRCLGWLMRRCGARWRITEEQDWAALVVMMLVFHVLVFLAEPVINGFSRMEEHEADVYGQEVVHGIVADPRQVALDAFQKLGEESLDDPAPHPLVEFWTSSHPSIAERMRFAAGYDPWRPGAEPRYFGK